MLVDQIIDYETGNLDTQGTLNLFAELIASGMCWKLQGHYGRAAQSLINNGVISPAGEIDQVLVDSLMEDN